jgi:HlyD family secretion protein
MYGDADPRATTLSVVVLMSAAFLACSQGAANETTDDLQTATVARQTIVSSVDATGTIEPIRIIEVKSQAGGEILELPVELGDYVEQGTLLARIDPRDVRNSFEQAQADLEVAQARFEVAERQLERIRSLHNSDIVTDEELETAILEHANSKAALVRAETNLELAEDKLNDVTLRAPISGTIVERSIEQGQVITGTRDLTGGTILMKMADLNQVQVRTLVDETDIGRLGADLPAEITVEAYPERTFRGTVLKIEPQAVVEQNVTMFAVLTRIENEEDLLRPGMNADVMIVVGRRSGVLALPNSAVKMPDEARQLAQALGLDMEDSSTRDAASGTDRPGGAGGDGAPEGRFRRGEGEAGESAEGNGAEGHREQADARSDASGSAEPEETIGGMPLSRLRTMSQDERRSWFQNLSGADRQRAFQLFRQQREQEEQANRADPTRPRAAFVFIAGPGGGLTLKPITIGLSNFDYTQVIEGLDEGDEVYSIPLSLVQQQELLERIRSRTRIPGVQRN